MTSFVVDLDQSFALDTVQLPDERQAAGDKDVAGVVACHCFEKVPIARHHVLIVFFLFLLFSGFANHAHLN